MISLTPATLAGNTFIITDEGYAALPPGTYTGEDQKIIIDNKIINHAEETDTSNYNRSLDKYVKSIDPNSDEVIKEITYLYETGRIDKNDYISAIETYADKPTNLKNSTKIKLGIRKADDELIFDTLSFDENNKKTNIVAGYQLYNSDAEVPIDTNTNEPWPNTRVGDRMYADYNHGDGLYECTLKNSAGVDTQYSVRKYVYGEVIVSHKVQTIAHLEFRPAYESSPATIVLTDLKLFKTDVDTGKTEVRCYTHVAPPPPAGETYTIDDFPIDEVGNPIINNVLVRTAPVVATSFGIYSIELAV